MTSHSFEEGHTFYCKWLVVREEHALGGPPIASIKQKTKDLRRWTFKKRMKRPNPYGNYTIIHKGTKEYW